MEGRSASAAIWDHLRQLCLDQFPCGIGSWNKSRFSLWRPPHLRGLAAPRQAPLPGRSVLQSPNEETVEALTDFLRCPNSPWALPPDCTPPEQQLRELAVQCPQIIRDSFLCSYFRSLRMVNKGVTEIDAGLLKFPNLEELILSANGISIICAANLPPDLKVLELCGNEVQSLKDLCTSPPAGLQHLGLSHNCNLGSSEEQYLADTFWPNLVSLDLSYNNFTSLLSLLSKLSTLSKLRILVLQGNPFALLPGYRGFTISSLPQISVLDDVIITPDEKHNFLNLAAFPELLLCDAKLIVTIGKIRGIPNPVGPEEPEHSLDSPVITYSYYVTYDFAKGEKRMDKEASKIYSTAGKAWAETVDCDYRKEHLTQELVALKAYLLAGTTVAIVEEKVVSWPVVRTPEEKPSKKGKGKGGGGGRGGEKGKSDPGKAEKGKKEKEKGKAKDAGKDKKKKKSPSPELRSDPPIVKILGSLHVSLEKLLAGASLVETICDFGVQTTELNAPLLPLKEKETRKSSKKDTKAKTGADSINSQKTPISAKGKGRKKDSPEGADLLLSQPVPLTVEFQMQHIKWESASHILKTQEASE